MAYGIIPYRVNLGRLASRFGMKDEAKRSKIRRMCSGYANNIDGLAYDEGVPKFMDIVEELLDGKATHTKYGYIYWYAIKGFVEELGLFIQNADWYPASADIFWENPHFVLYGIDAPMEIPTPDDFPTVFVLRNDRMNDDLIESLVKKLSNNVQIDQLKNWIKEAKRYKQDLILYYH
jgi:hypothetical protein